METRVPLVLVHETPGRVRLRCVGLRENSGLGETVRSVVRDLPGLDGVSVRPGSESLVLRYSLEDSTPDEFMQALRSRVDLSAPPAEDGAGAAAVEPIGAQLIHSLRSGWTRANRKVFYATQGRMDLQSSVPWVMLFLALRQIVGGGNLPALPWYTALYYSLQAILRYPDEATQPAHPPEPIENAE